VFQRLNDHAGASIHRAEIVMAAPAKTREPLADKASALCLNDLEWYGARRLHDGGQGKDFGAQHFSSRALPTDLKAGLSVAG
jgi:hypothetical protein